MGDLKVSRSGIGLIIAVLMACAIVLGAQSALADVTIKQTVLTSGLGGMMDAKTTLVTCIKGDKKCEDSEMKLTNKMMSFMGGGKPIKTSTIVDLERDPGVIVNIDHQTKSYTETPIGQISEMMENSGFGGMMGAEGEYEDEESEELFDTSRVTMNPPRIDVKKTGEKEKISGYSCEQSILTMEADGVDKETGEEFTFTVTFDMWLAKDVEGAQEYLDFSNKMAEDAGFGTFQMTGEGMLASLSGYGIDPDEVKDKLKDIEGFPIRQTMTFSGEGGQFAMQMSDEDQEAMEEGKEKMAEAMSKFKGLFGGGGDDEDDADESAEEESTGGALGDALMKVTVTVTDINTSSVSDDHFTPPAKYKANK